MTLDNAGSEKIKTLFDQRVVQARKMGYAGNNELFHILLENGEERLVKAYANYHVNGWRRGEVEFRALSHLSNIGFGEVPKAFYFSPETNTGVYEFIHGRPVRAQDIKEEGIERMSTFLTRLHSLPTEHLEQWGPASTASFCLQDYMGTIEARLANVLNHSKAGIGGERADWLIEGKLLPLIGEVKREFETIDPEERRRPLSLAEQVITPGDFGPHNQMQRDDGSYTFLDFEYFGRDDPAREVLNFLHHDQTSTIPRSLKEKFVRDYLAGVNASPEFEKRMHRADPLVGTTWALIYLHILSKPYLERFKLGEEEARKLVQERISKAEAKLENIRYF